MNSQERAFVLNKVREHHATCPACRSTDLEPLGYQAEVFQSAVRYTLPVTDTSPLLLIRCTHCGIVHMFDTKTLGITGKDGCLVEGWEGPDDN